MMSDTPVCNGISPALSIQYVAGGDLEQVRSALIQRLVQNGIPYGQGESHTDIAGLDPANRIAIYSPHWLDVGLITLSRIDPSQVLVRIFLPAFPGEKVTEYLEERIRAALPPPALAIRLMDVDGDWHRILAYLGRKLHELRLRRLQEIQSLLANSLGWIPAYGLAIERPRITITAAASASQGLQAGESRDIPRQKLLGQTRLPQQLPAQQLAPQRSLREDQQELLRLWQAGHTARQIALRTSKTEKTILNQLTLLRKLHGEEVVPRRR